MEIVMANQGGNNVGRDYRKGNWTVQETMVLIEAKKMDDERRMKKHGVDTSEKGKPAELRWKWVEDYCWRNSCLRSQNQCNDKWDNLMRDFKKVREYEKGLAQDQGDDHHQSRSYWGLEKNERKARNLPSNMLPQIYNALVEVVERKCQRGVVVVVGGGAAGSTSTSTNPNISSTVGHHQHSSQLPPPLQHPIPTTSFPVLPLPPTAQTSQQHPPPPFSQPLPTVDSDTSEHSDSPAKRRRRRGGGGEGTTGKGTASGSSPQEVVGSAISRSASIIAEAIQACEEREERRHRELLSLHERRLQIEESKAEISRQGINGLVDAVNKLANSILALAAQKNQAASK